MNKTIGYMYFNGFHDIVAEKDEYRFIKMIASYSALNETKVVIVPAPAIKGNATGTTETILELAASDLKT